MSYSICLVFHGQTTPREPAIKPMITAYVAFLNRFKTYPKTWESETNPARDPKVKTAKIFSICIRSGFEIKPVSPCINSETGKEFEENDPPLGEKSLNPSLEKLPRMLWIRFRNNRGDGGFLACEDRECKVTADESAWAGFGRRRTRTIEALKSSMKEKSIH